MWLCTPWSDFQIPACMGYGNINFHIHSETVVQARYSAAKALAHPWISQDGAAPDTPLDVLVVQNIRKFAGYNRVKQAILVEIAKTFDPNEIVDLRRQFALLDKDGSGTISIEEMVNALGDLRTGESATTVFSAQDIQEVSGLL